MMYYNNYGGNFSEGIREGIKNSFRKGSSLTRLIYINCGIFLALKLIYIMMLLLGKEKNFIRHCWNGSACRQIRSIY